MKVLLVSQGLPPRKDGSSAITNVLASQFSPDEMVLAGEHTPLHDGYVSPAGTPPSHYVSRQWQWPPRGKRYVRWMRWLQVGRIARRLRALASDCDAIVATFPDAYHLVAASRAGRALGIPVIPYMHNTYADARRGMAGWIARRIVPRLFARAPLVMVMSEGMKEHYQPSYPDVRFVPLVHSLAAEPLADPPPAAGEPLSLALLGNINHSNLDAARRMAEAMRSLDRPARLTLYTTQPRFFLDRNGLCGDDVTVDVLPYDEVLDGLRRHDVLLLPHGLVGPLPRVEYDTIFPTRTASYVFVGRPIVALSPPDCFLTRWLRQRDAAELVTTADTDAIAAAILRAATDEARRAELVRRAAAAAECFRAPAVSAQLRAILAEVVGEAV